MLSKSFRESGHLLHSLDALQHGRAFLLSGATWLVALALWALADFLLTNKGWAPLVVLLSLLSTMVLIGGANAVGIMTMDDVALRPPRPSSVLWREALSASQQMVLVLLTMILCSLLALLALALLLLICRLPIVGPWLYAAVLPLATVVAAMVLFVFPVFVLALSAPAIWCGMDASNSLIQIWSVIRRRLPAASGWLFVLAAITATACLLLLGVLALGFWLVNTMSVSLLGTSGAWPTDLSGVGRVMAADGSNYTHAASAGFAAITALVCTMVGLVALRGICLVYEHVLTGLDTEPEKQFVQAALAGAHKDPQQRQTHTPLQPPSVNAGEAALRNSWQPSNSGASTISHHDAAVSSDGLAQPIQPRLQSVDIDLEGPGQHFSYSKCPCPACGSSTELTDFYCGECGKSLQ